MYMYILTYKIMGSNFLTKLIKMTNHSKELILKSVRESQ